MPRILLVEDDMVLSSVLEMALRGKGYEVELAYDGIEAVKKAHSFKPDLIILDVNLPKLSGFDVAIKLKQANQLKHIPIIMLTALSQDVNITRGYNLGVEDYITKPFNLEHLLLKINKYCHA